MGGLINLSGIRFGRLTAIERSPDQRGKTMWLCRCACGIEKPIRATGLRNEGTKSCGCLQREHSARQADLLRTHGASRRINGKPTPEYKAYQGAKERCNWTGRENYADYGGRGIKFLFSSFEQFYGEVGDRPDGMTLDRIDVNGHYAPGNIRWASKSTQSKNQRRNLLPKFTQEQIQKIKDAGLWPE